MLPRLKLITSGILIAAILALPFAEASAENFPLKRNVPIKPVYDKIPTGVESDQIVIKLKEGMGQPELVAGRFQRSGPEWDRLNELIVSRDKAAAILPSFTLEKNELNRLRAEGMTKSGAQLADLTLYNTLKLDEGLTDQEKLAKVTELNSLDIVEIAYFPPKPDIASINESGEVNTPAWETGQYYLQPAPTGIDAYYAWSFAGGKGESVKVIDIEGNWIQTHEDLHGGTDDFHIAGTKINDPGWYHHGTAVLGEIAADSNNFGMTGIAFNCDLGTISIGSLSTANALLTAINNSDTGDVFLIELHAPGPHYNFESPSGQDGYVAMEYWQDIFDVILQASALDRIVVEAGGNGSENYDDTGIYGSLFDPSFRFSGAIMVAASWADHVPAGFTNYGQRLDVHAFGTWDVYTLGYGDLYGSSVNDYYTNSFAGTSSASPIITGSCAVMQGISKAVHGSVLDHNEMRYYLTTFSTPQAPNPKLIGPLPDLQGGVDDLVGVFFSADTTFGWAPFTVDFVGSSGLTVDSWKWSFGDGDSAFVQTPSHTYMESGLYTVGIEVTAGAETRAISRSNYILAVADTMRADTSEGGPGDQIVVTISANNTISVSNIKIPVEYPGNVSLSLDSFSTVGCRTDYFEEVDILHFDPFFKRFTIRLLTSTSGSVAQLPPGNGPVLKLYWSIDPSAEVGQSATIITDGYSSYSPEFLGGLVDYVVPTQTGLVSVINVGCCLGIRGNVDGDSSDLITIGDILYYVDYSFAVPPGPPPPCIEEADVDGIDGLTIADLLYLVEYSFDVPAGPAPVACP